MKSLLTTCPFTILTVIMFKHVDYTTVLALAVPFTKTVQGLIDSNKK